jgi:hypothetical protein
MRRVGVGGISGVGILDQCARAGRLLLKGVDADPVNVGDSGQHAAGVDPTQDAQGVAERVLVQKYLRKLSM